MKDKFTEEQIRGFFSGDYDHLTCKEFRELTRPKPEFSEGQVVRVFYADDDQPIGDGYVPWSHWVDQSGIIGSVHPLTLTEHGKDVRDLRDVVRDACERLLFDSTDAREVENGREQIEKALARFDAAVKDD